MTRKEFCKTNGITEDQFYGKEVINKNIALSHLQYVPIGFNPQVVNGFLDLGNVRSLRYDFNSSVNGWLDLGNVIEIKSFNVQVGFNLWLTNLSKLPKEFHVYVAGSIYLNRNIICGELKCTESVKENLSLMIRSDDRDIQNLALSALWQYRTEDIKKITQSGKIYFI